MARASHATALKARRPSGPRKPARGRGVLRYDVLVDATERLLRTEDPDEIGLYRIAEEAQVPPASVYHFFPTKEAAYTALAMRVMDELVAQHREPIPAERIQTWQNLFRIDIDRARNFYNDHAAGLKILYGGYGGVDARDVDRAVSSRLSHASYARLSTIFHMPFLHEPETKFENRMAILDAIWSLSVRKCGYINDEYHEEAYQACIAYTRTFLPERVEIKDVLKNAVLLKQTICLPYDSFMVDAQPKEAL